jgi:hypothetical protein
MKSIIFIIMLLVSSLLIIDAGNCHKDLNYCGSTLMTIRDYTAEMQAAAHEDSDSSQKLFKCTCDKTGAIKFIQNCDNGCTDNGPGNSDTCTEQPPADA